MILRKAPFGPLGLPGPLELARATQSLRNIEAPRRK
jgi:hypothetical protein